VLTISPLFSQSSCFYSSLYQFSFFVSYKIIFLRSRLRFHISGSSFAAPYLENYYYVPCLLSFPPFEQVFPSLRLAAFLPLAIVFLNSCYNSAMLFLLCPTFVYPVTRKSCKGLVSPLLLPKPSRSNIDAVGPWASNFLLPFFSLLAMFNLL